MIDCKHRPWKVYTLCASNLPLIYLLSRCHSRWCTRRKSDSRLTIRKSIEFVTYLSSLLLMRIECGRQFLKWYLTLNIHLLSFINQRSTQRYNVQNGDSTSLCIVIIRLNKNNPIFEYWSITHARVQFLFYSEVYNESFFKIYLWLFICLIEISWIATFELKMKLRIVFMLCESFKLPIEIYIPALFPL